jgi:hypothetical protein
MKGQLKVGNGSGNLDSILGLTPPLTPDLYSINNTQYTWLALIFSIIIGVVLIRLLSNFSATGEINTRARGNLQVTFIIGKHFTGKVFSKFVPAMDGDINIFGDCLAVSGEFIRVVIHDHAFIIHDHIAMIHRCKNRQG